MTDRYDELAVAPDPTRAEGLRAQLHARMLDSSLELQSAPGATPGPDIDGDAVLLPYSVGTGEALEGRRRRWLAIVGAAAALLLFVPLVVALVRLTDDDTLDVGPAMPSTTQARDPRVVAQVTDPSGPLQVQATRDAVWVGNSSDGTVSRIDPVTNQVVATIASLPTPFRLDATDDSVWIVDGGTSAGAGGQPAAEDTITAIRIDPATNQRVATIAFPVTPGLAGSDVAVTDDAVWVAAGTSVTRIDPSTNQITATIPVQRRVIYVDATDNAVWVSSLDQGSDQITRIDPATNRVVATIPGIAGAMDIAATDDAVWVADGASQELVEVDPATDQIATRVALPSGVNGLAVGDAVVRVTLMDGSLYRVDPTDHQLTRTIDLGLGDDSSISIARDAVWVTSLSTETITRIDPGSR